MKKLIFLLGLAAMLSLASCASEPTTSRENTVTQPATTQQTTALREGGGGAPAIR